MPPAPGEPIRIANCSGFFGDRPSGAREMVEGGPIDVLTGDWLAELTMLILARRRAKRPGDVVVVVGCGGIGMNAVQGAAMAGAKRVVAVDPLEFKREKAMEFGATDTFASMEEAMVPVAELTEGRMAEVVIMTPGVLYGDMMNLGTKLASKGGTIVATAVAPMSQTSADINLSELTLWNKEIKGTIFGSLNPRADIPNLLSMYTAGTLKLDELITNTYPLDQINDGYQAMRDGTNIRGVIAHAPA